MINAARRMWRYMDGRWSSHSRAGYRNELKTFTNLVASLFIYGLIITGCSSRTQCALLHRYFYVHFTNTYLKGVMDSSIMSDRKLEERQGSQNDTDVGHDIIISLGLTVYPIELLRLLLLLNLNIITELRWWVLGWGRWHLRCHDDPNGLQRDIRLIS